MTNKKFKEGIRPHKPKIRLDYLGKSLLVRGENKRKFEELRAKILKEIGPCNEIEKLLCDKFIFCVWRHRRIIEIERSILSDRNTPDVKMTQEEIERELIENQFNFDPFSKKGGLKRRVRNIKKLRIHDPEMQNLLKYEVTLQKSMLKILERIREEQKLRKDIVQKRVG